MELGDSLWGGVILGGVVYLVPCGLWWQVLVLG